MKRLISLSLAIVFSFSYFPPAFGYSQMQGFLCEIGINFYQQGRYDEALHEFKKALLVEPNYPPALKYIQMIEQIRERPAEVKGVVTAGFKAGAPTSYGAMKEYLDLIELQRGMIEQKKKVPEVKKAAVKPSGKIAPEAIPEILPLDESFAEIQFPIEIEQGKSIIIIGRNIQRFLSTNPQGLIVEQKSDSELEVTGKDIGYTYLHVWDDLGRWTAEFLTILPRPEGPTLEEEMLLEEGRANSFKLQYSLMQNSFSLGRGISDLKRRAYTYQHNLGLSGTTPYGNIDSLAIIKTISALGVKRSTDLTYFTFGLTEGKWGPFTDLTIRGFDFYPTFSNLASGGIGALRGGMISSPAFDKKIDYTAFWGREGSGKYGALSPGLQKQLRKYIDGIDFNYRHREDSDYGFSILNGYGLDRRRELPGLAYDARVAFHIRNWATRYEVAQDGQNLAHLLSGHYDVPKIKFIYELRDVDKDFFSIGGESWRRGERGGLFTLNFRPSEKLNIFNHLDIYQDRLFPSKENANRLNEDYDFLASYDLDPTATLRARYNIQNDLGKVSEMRYQDTGIGASKTFNLIRKVYAYADVHHQERKNYSNPISDYTNENVSFGLRFSLIGQLYFFLDDQFNWLKETFTCRRTEPSALQTGVDLAGQILNTPFYENLRFIYRNEEDASSPLSFFSGEDYIEGYAELSYRPNPDFDTYCSTRVRNVWADNPNATKRVEAEFNAGMRYLWDTGVRWEAVGNIEGYVFRDLNSDNLRQRDEAPVEGIKLLLGKNRSAVTDLFGFYRFSGVKGKIAYVVFDPKSLPSGFVLTGPNRQDVSILQGRTGRADFGIISRSEIYGIVFEDENHDQEFNPGEQVIKGVKLVLEDGKQVVTSGEGKYVFRNATAGGHELTLDLNSLPKDYLPQVPMTKKIILTEGLSYNYSIPLKKIKK